MNTSELLACLRGCHLTAGHFTQVYAADLLPTPIPHRPAAIICNTDPSDQEGTHWTAFYLPKSKQQPVEFFDSFARKPEYYSPHFTKFLEENAKKWIKSAKTVQAPLSWTCGEHCLFYLKLRCGGISMKNILKQCYTNNVERNDEMVSLNHIVMRDHCKPVACAVIQSCKPIAK